MITLDRGFDFELPDAFVAREPPEARGLERDAVKLLVTARRRDGVSHARFSDLPGFLEPGDLLVVNTSATFNAALEASRAEASGSAECDVLLHLSTPLAGDRWVVEVRRLNAPLLDAEPGERLALPEGASARLLEPYARPQGSAPWAEQENAAGFADAAAGRVRLWVATLTLPQDVFVYTARHGSPVRYGYVPRRWPLSAYRTVFSRDPGSAEMPSAGRPFTPRLLARLGAAGVRVAPLLLHTGVSSLDADEPPYPERFRVPEATAHLVNRTRAAGGRVVAVGTTSVRALETVAASDGSVQAGEGWTELVVTPERGVRAVDAILTGLHGPSASHLGMLEALAGRQHLTRAYEAALRGGYLWHEFGDAHLLLP